MQQETIAPEAAPQPTPDIPSLATPSAFGGDIAQAGGELAANVGAKALQRHEIDLRNQYEDELTQGQLRIANTRETLGAQIEALQRDPNLDLTQYSKQVGSLFDQAAGAVTDGVTNTRVQRQLAGQLGEMKAQYGEQANSWQTVQTAGAVAAGSQQLFSKIGGQAYLSADPAQITVVNTQIGDYVHGLVGLTPDQRMALVAQGVSQNASNFGFGLASRDPDAARKLFDQGWFAQNGLKEQQLHVLDRTITVAARQKEAHAQAAALAGQTAQIVAGEEVMRTIDAGGSVPVPQVMAMAQQFRAAADASTAAGKPKPELFAMADRLTGAVEKMDVTAKYRVLPPAQIAAAAQEADAEAARRRAAGQAISLAEGARLTAIKDLATQTTAAVNTDPWSLAAPRGVAAVPLDPNNPATYAQRTTQAQQLQKVLGLNYPVSPLQKEEAEQLGKQAASSEAGRMSALASLDHFDAATRDIAARQAMPHDGTFAIEAGLDPFNRTVVQQGRERTVADQAFWNAKPVDALPGEKAPAKAHLDALGARLDAALGSVADQTQIAGLKTTAANWIAGMMVRQGRSNGMAITDTDVQNGLRAALGGHVTSGGQVTGGIGSWGSPNNVYVLPNSMNATGFSNFVNRQVAADRTQGRGPVNPDGTPFNLTQAKPVFQGGGKYIWTTPSGVVMMPARPHQAPQPYTTRGAQ